jgi:hypothetical protein
LHDKFHLKVDTIFPSEIMTLATLHHAMDSLPKLNVSTGKVLEGRPYDHLFWACVLTDKKIGFIGDGKGTLFPFIRKAEPHVERWKQQIIAELQSKETFSKQVHAAFPKLTRTEILAALEKLEAHQIIQLCLNVDNSTSYIVENEALKTPRAKVKALDLSIFKRVDNSFNLKELDLITLSHQGRQHMVF